MITSTENRATTQREENEIYGWIDYEASLQYREEIRQQVAAIRLEKSAREGRKGRGRLMEDTRWELERYAGLLMKRLRNPR